MATAPVSKRKRKVPKRTQPAWPRVDKTTTYDTMTREELMRHRDEEVENYRNAKAQSS
jgi:hypothetical protein